MSIALMPQHTLDRDACRQARLSRDPRFDGEFFFGVSSTGIYCRPICPARAPAEKHVAYFSSAALAAKAGFRPCLRCRPESAPDSPAWLGTSVTVHRAVGLIQEGALNQGSVASLCARLGIGERYLRKLFQREMGISPQELALNQRLLFAKKLLAETDLSVTDVAYAAGFNSIRRFNSAIREHFRLKPGQLRRHSKTPARGARDIVLKLGYRPPYDWTGVLGFFRRHAVSGVEQVSATHYYRIVELAGENGEIQVSHDPAGNAVQLGLKLSEPGQIMPLVSRIRRMFDLDANPQVISHSLCRDRWLSPLIEAFPGIRSPGYGSLYEAAFRAIVGQQVSTSAARTVCAKIAAAGAAERAHFPFPSAEAVPGLDDNNFAMPGRRRESLRLMCRAFADTESPSLEQLGQIRGIGPWTVAMAAMRGTGDPDIMPFSDLGLQQAWSALGADTIELNDHAASYWRPWRSYAANLLWRSLGNP